MKVQLLKDTPFVSLHSGDVFSVTIDGKTEICMKTDHIVDEYGVEHNAVFVATGKYLLLTNTDVVDMVTYVAEGSPMSKKGETI